MLGLGLLLAAQQQLRKTQEMYGAWHPRGRQEGIKWTWISAAANESTLKAQTATVQATPSQYKLRMLPSQHQPVQTTICYAFATR